MRLILLIPLIASLFLTACGPAREDHIVVGSKNFPEQAILGELFAQRLEKKTHLPVERRFYLAGSSFCHQAILFDRIDLSPEYTGPALTAILKEKPQVIREQVYERVKPKYDRRFHRAP